MDQISILVKQNDYLKKLIHDTYQLNDKTTSHEMSKINQANSSFFLKNIFKTFIKNCSSTSQASNRYSDTIKKFSIYLYFVGGRLLYETLQANLNNSLPSISTLFRFISLNKENVEEGEFRINQLKSFLVKRNLPLCVWISEDGTRITGKIEYDTNSNKLVGFVMPLIDGCPKTDTFMATSAREIINHFETGIKSDYAYAIMAQPLSPSAPSFCLSIFGTDNRFTYEDVLKRWEKIHQLASDVGISIIGFSSDGDTRLLKSMNIKTFSGRDNTVENNTENIRSQVYVQDTVHIGTKLRTRLLKPGIALPMGKYVASVSHLHEMIEQFSKDKHQLTTTDLNAVDKMNFHAAEKICSPVVIQLLQNIEKCKGTVAYLELMQNVLGAFLDKTLNVRDRIYKMWYSVYFLRIWRYALQKSSVYALQKNFVTYNIHMLYVY